MLNSTLIHNLVSKARTTLIGLACDVTHKTILSKDGYGKIKWSTGTVLKAFASKEQKRIVVSDGREVVSGFQLIIPENFSISVADQIIMPDGSTPPILKVSAALDDFGQPYASEVYF